MMNRIFPVILWMGVALLLPACGCRNVVCRGRNELQHRVVRLEAELKEVQGDRDVFRADASKLASAEPERYSNTVDSFSNSLINSDLQIWIP